MKHVFIDGVEYAPVKALILEKQGIREYCKERHVWARKTPMDVWAFHSKRPGMEITSDPNFALIHFAQPEYFIFPEVSWQDSLIAPDGSMPLFEPYGLIEMCDATLRHVLNDYYQINKMNELLPPMQRLHPFELGPAEVKNTLKYISLWEKFNLENRTKFEEWRTGIFQ